MRTYSVLFVGTSLLFLVLFVVVTALDVPILTNPQPFFDEVGLLGAATIGIGLLVGDVLLPVPSSLVMIAHGALFGVTVGSLVSLIGVQGGAAVGFALGRRGGDRIHRIVSAEERRRADQLLERWGVLAVVVTRPVPIMAETVAILAGTSPLSWRRFLLASLLGNLSPCVLYAVTGATAARLDSAVFVFGFLMLIAALVWIGGRLMLPKTEHRESSRPGPASRVEPRD